MDKKGEYQEVPSKNFCLTLPKSFVGEPSSMSLVLVIEKIYDFEGYVTIFSRNFFASQYLNIS